MVDKVTLLSVTGTQNQTSLAAALNSNFNTIITAFNNTLSRNGSSPNTMENDLDMNSKRIINLPDAVYDSEPITLRQSVEYYGDLQDHINNVSNPHSVTKDQIGLGNVDNTSDANKAVSIATQAALDALDLAKVNLSDYTAGDVLIKVKSVDGNGSGLDADLVRGTTPSTFGLDLLDSTNSTDARNSLGLGTTDSVTFGTTNSTDLNISGDSTFSNRPTVGGVGVALQSELSGAIYNGLWDASTNTPTIVSSTGLIGEYYIISIAGTTTIDGISSWSIGDQIRFNGTVWEKIPQFDAVSSVSGKTGAVTLVSSDVGLGNVDNTADLDKPISTATQDALDTKQPLDATLTALAGVTTSADKLIYSTGSDLFSTTSLSAAARTVLDDATVSDMRTTLGLAIGTDVQAYDADIAAIGALSGTSGLLQKTAANTWSLEPNNIVLASRFGVQGGTGTDQVTALNAALAYVGANGGTLVLPEFVYLGTRASITSTSKSFRIMGGSIIVANSLGGLYFQPTAYEHQIDVINVNFYAGMDGAGRPTYFNYPTPTSARSRSMALINCRFELLVPNDASYSWASGNKFYNCWHGVVHSCQFNGAENNNRTSSSEGFISDGYSINMSFIACYVSSVSSGFKYRGESEGGRFLQCNVVDAEYGINAIGTTENPQLVIQGCHFNVTTRGVYAVDWNSVMINNCLFYRLGTVVGYRDVEFTRCDFSVVSGSSAHLGGSVENWFVYATDSNYVQVMNNRLEGRWHHVQLNGTSSRCTAKNNVPSATFAADESAEMVDNSTGTYNRLEHWRESNSAIVVLRATGSAAANNIPNTTETAITWNTVVYNEQGAFDAGSPTIVTVPYWAKSAEIALDVSFASNTTGYRWATVKIGATEQTRATATPVSGVVTTVSVPTARIPVSGGNTISFTVRQTSGGSLQVSSDLTRCYIKFYSW